MAKGGIIDIHTHIFHEKLAPMMVNYIGECYGARMQGKGTADDLIRSADAAGISGCVIFTTAANAEQVQNFNDFIARNVTRHKQFIGFGSLHPKMEDPAAEIDRILSLGLKGIKLHPFFQQFNLEDDGVTDLFAAAEGRLPVLIHVGNENEGASGPQKLVKLLEKFPRLTVVAAHLGGYKLWKDAKKYLAGSNVYLDTSSSLAFLEKEEAVDLIRSHGVDKVLFGSDYPMWSYKDEINRFDSLGLENEERELILWKNTRKLLNLSFPE